MVAETGVAVSPVLIEKDAVCFPAPTVTLPSTATHGELLLRATTAAVGVGLLSATVPVTVRAPETLAGTMSEASRTGGRTVSVACRLVPPAVAVIVTLVAIVTDVVVTGNVALS